MDAYSLFLQLDKDYKRFPLPICFDPDEERKWLYHRDLYLKELAKRFVSLYYFKKSKKMNDFEAMNIMSENDQDIRMGGIIVNATKNKQGGRITFQVDGPSADLILKQMFSGETTHYVALYMVNKEQFDEIKKRKKHKK